MAVNPAAANTAPQITGAIQQAARSSGISFEYLLTTAKIESNLNPAAQAATSSAKGMYQFIEQTWLGTMKAGGAASGYGRYADAISRTADGRYEVADADMRAAIMQLRSDPAASAMMAGAFTRANATQLQAAIGRAPTEGELYIAHFLGSEGAGKLITTASSQPSASAADMFPQAAAANRGIFYDSAGRARSASDVYARLSNRFEVARAMNFAPDVTASVKIASVEAPPDTSRLLPIPAPRPVSRDTAGVTQAFAAASQAVPALPDSRPLFQSMFTDGSRKAVTQTVRSLWATGRDQPPASADQPRRLDLFTDTRSDSRKPSSGKNS